MASNLNELYGYVLRRLLHVNAYNDLQTLTEIHGLITEVREAWRQVPALLPAGSPSLQH